MVCIITGWNPAVKIKWYMGHQEIQTGHTQTDTKVKPRAWKSVSFLKLPDSESDNEVIVRAVAQPHALENTLEQKLGLTIYSLKQSK